MNNWKRFQDLPTKELIILCQNPSFDKDCGDDAFLALCFRFRGDLVKKCEILCKKKGYDIEVAYEITKKTFEKYGRSKAFKVEKCKHSDLDLGFKVYLYRIAANELNDYYRFLQKKKKGLTYDGTEGIITTLPDVDLDSLDVESRMIHEAIKGFSNSHQVVYYTYLVYEKDGVKLPRTLLKELREHLGGISQVTIRGYKKAVADKVASIKYISQTLKTKS